MKRHLLPIETKSTGLLPTFTSKFLRKSLLSYSREFKQRENVSGVIQEGDVVIQLFAKNQKLVISSAFAELDAIGWLQPLPWAGRFHRTSKPNESCILQEVISNYDIESDQFYDTTCLLFGDVPTTWTQLLMENSATIVHVQAKKLGPAYNKYKHELANALEFLPSAQNSDWIIGNLLLPPSESLGILLKYLSNNIPNRFIWCFQLQLHPTTNWNEVVGDIRTALAGLPSYHYRIRHIYKQGTQIVMWGQHQTITEEFHHLNENVFVEDLDPPDYKVEEVEIDITNPTVRDDEVFEEDLEDESKY